MSLRLRLIVAFFLFSVVPLAAVTFYSYTSNLRALQVAAEAPDSLAAWTKDRTAALALPEAIATELRAGVMPDLAMLVVASRQLREALG